MRVVLLLAAFAGATAFAPIGTSTLMLRNLVPFPFYVNRDSMCTTRYTRRLGHLVCTLASPDEQLETEEHDEPMNRKERRRLNRRNRNNQRNRIVDQRTQASIPRKEGLSQNFLSDEGVIERFAGLAFDGRATMAGTADASDPDGHRLVELGPGLGAVTQALQHGGANSKMTAVELDRQSCAHLREAFPDMDVREESLLEFDFAAHAASRGGRLTVVSNAPFGISSATLYHLLDHSEHISRAVLLLQQEVVHRVLADTSKRKYSSLSVEHALRADALREAFVVPAIAFTPPPRRTKTSVLVIDFAEEAPVTPAEGRILRASLQSAFKEKGQTLRDSLWRSRELRGLVPSLRALCDDADFNWLDKRPSELAVGKWLHVARSLESVAAAMAATSQEAEAGAGKIAEE